MIRVARPTTRRMIFKLDSKVVPNNLRSRTRIEENSQQKANKSIELNANVIF